MSKLLLPILCLCLAAWLFAGSIWFGNQYAQNDQHTSWSLQDGEHQFSSSTTFSFQKSDPEIILDDNQHAMIAEIAQYLLEHTDRNLELQGLYTSKELNNSDYENLGLARAESFRYLIYRQGVNLEQLQVASKLIKSHNLNNNGVINGGVNFTFIESPLLKYSPDFSLVKEIRFEEASEVKVIDIDFGVYAAGLRQYLVDHPDKKIKLTGFSKSVQQNAITRKRVYNLEKNLTKIGIESEKISYFLEALDGQNDADSYVEIRIL